MAFRTETKSSMKTQSGQSQTWYKTTLYHAGALGLPAAVSVRQMQSDQWTLELDVPHVKGFYCERTTLHADSQHQIHKYANFSISSSISKSQFWAF